MPDLDVESLSTAHDRSDERILFVDDESHILSSFERELGKRYDIVTADSGAKALELIATGESCAVIVSDQKMLEMDGVELLSRIQKLAPDTVRIMLTGNADLNTAIEAVNQGYIFRFLTKPCPPETLMQALDAGIEQYNLIMLKRENHSLQKLRLAMEGIIKGFSTVVETRDPYTAGHQGRVAKLAVAIAESMGLDRERITALRLAAMVHDIGKIYVPADFLNKPGKLTDVEFSILWTHPTIGRDILKSVDFVWPISEIVAQHHERIDGTGYPEGLTGDQIRMESRIMAVADVVDAMASHRPYRPSLGMEKALEEIETNKGIHFDPDAVDACLRLFREEGFQLFEEEKSPIPNSAGS